MIAIPPPFAFVVDTEQYAGNFERLLGAWVTGRAGECGVGEKEAASAQSAMDPTVREWLDDHAMPVISDNGGTYYASIWATPGWFNDGLGNEWPDDSDPEVVKAKYLAARARHQPDRADAAYLGTRYPSYKSVVVFFSHQPPPEVLAFMRRQAAAFNGRRCRGKYDGDIKVTGSRLLKIGLSETEIL